jgi:hypothetical protein
MNNLPDRAEELRTGMHRWKSTGSAFTRGQLRTAFSRFRGQVFHVASRNRRAVVFATSWKLPVCCAQSGLSIDRNPNCRVIISRLLWLGNSTNTSGSMRPCDLAASGNRRSGSPGNVSVRPLILAHVLTISGAFRNASQVESIPCLRPAVPRRRPAVHIR